MKVDSETYRRMVDMAGGSLGFTDVAPEGYIKIAEVNGRWVTAKEDGVAKLIRGTVTVARNSEGNLLFLSGDGNSLTIDNALQVFTKPDSENLKRTMRQNLKKRRQNLNKTKIVKLPHEG